MSFKRRLAAKVIKKAQQGDKFAFTHIYHQYKSAIYSLALRILRDSDAAEDIVHQVIEKVLVKIRDLDDVTKFNGWLKTLSYRTTIDYLNKRARDISMDLVDEVIDIASFDVNTLDIEKYLAILKPMERLVVILFLVEGYKHKEIAIKLDISEPSSKQIYRRSLNKLKLLESKVAFSGG